MPPNSAPRATSVTEKIEEPLPPPESKTKAEPMSIAIIEGWFQTHRERLLATMTQISGNFHTAEDIVQETFASCIRVVEGPHGFQGRSQSYSWLFRVAYNIYYDMLRRRTNKELTSMPSSRDESFIFENSMIFMDHKTQSGLEAVQQMEMVEAVKRILKHMSPEFAEVLKLHDLDGLRYDDIAKILGVPVGTVRSRIHRGRDEFYRLFLMTSLSDGLGRGLSPSGKRPSKSDLSKQQKAWPKKNRLPQNRKIPLEA